MDSHELLSNNLFHPTDQCAIPQIPQNVLANAVICNRSSKLSSLAFLLQILESRWNNRPTYQRCLHWLQLLLDSFYSQLCLANNRSNLGLPLLPCSIAPFSHKMEASGKTKLQKSWKVIQIQLTVESAHRILPRVLSQCIHEYLRFVVQHTHLASSNFYFVLSYARSSIRSSIGIDSHPEQ